MQLRWFPDNSVALIILPSVSASAQQLCLMSHRFVFPIIIADYKIDVRVQPTLQISNKMVKELITLERE